MKVYMISRPQMDWSAFCRFLADEGVPEAASYAVEHADDASRLCEAAGRLCYMSYGKGRKTNKEFLDNIIRSGHHSVLEHANWTFIITGVSRSLTHELVRHRHLSYSQLSQRYVDESDAQFILPPVLFDGDKMQDGVTDAMHMAREAYRGAVSRLDAIYAEDTTLTATERRKAARQAARAVLPNATETKICVTGNARAWREFIQKRNSRYADPEIRGLAQEIERQLIADAANLFDDLREAREG